MVLVLVMIVVIERLNTSSNLRWDVFSHGLGYMSSTVHIKGVLNMRERRNHPF